MADFRFPRPAAHDELPAEHDDRGEEQQLDHGQAASLAWLRRGAPGHGQAQVGDQRAQLLPRDEVAGAELAELALVEQRQARGEQLAVDHPLRQAVRDAEADALAKLGQRLVDAPLVARVDVLDAVAHHHPVHLAARLAQLLHRPALARFPDQLGVEAQAADLEGLGVDLADQVEVDEAVVHRRDQRVGLGGGVARVADRRGPGVSKTTKSQPRRDRRRRCAVDAASSASIESPSNTANAAPGSSIPRRCSVSARFSK